MKGTGIPCGFILKEDEDNGTGVYVDLIVTQFYDNAIICFPLSANKQDLSAKYTFTPPQWNRSENAPVSRSYFSRLWIHPFHDL